MSNIYYVLSSSAYDILIYMKIQNIAIKVIDLVKLCKMSKYEIRSSLRRLQEHHLINKVYPQIYYTDSRMAYIISERGIKLLNQLEQAILTYYNMDGPKQQLVTYNN